MTNNNIELRGEKLRHIIGEIPSRIVRYGIIVITTVILILLVGAYHIPYPQTVNAKIQVITAYQCRMSVPYRYVNTIERGMIVNIEVDGYDAKAYGVVNGIIISTSQIPKQTSVGNVFAAKVKITDSKYKLINGMTGTASILISDESVLQMITKQIRSNLFKQREDSIDI